MIPYHARSTKCQRAYDEKPTSSGEYLSTVWALSERGIETALCFEDTFGTVFLFFLEHFLSPLLQPAQSVILDNVETHKVEGVKELIEQIGVRLI
jgi:hypothetical protein